jgi:hypothetical protein
MNVKRVMHTILDIYVFIAITAGGLLVPEGVILETLRSLEVAIKSVDR